jgi:hypothetical protein
MIGFVLLLPMVFLSTAVSAFVAVLVAVSAVLSLVMTVFIGAMVTYSTAFLAFLIMTFS